MNNHEVVNADYIHFFLKSFCSTGHAQHARKSTRETVLRFCRIKFLQSFMITRS